MAKSNQPSFRRWNQCTHTTVSQICVLNLCIPNKCLQHNVTASTCKNVPSRDLVLGHPRPWWWKNGSMIWEDKKVVETKQKGFVSFVGNSLVERWAYSEICRYMYIYISIWIYLYEYMNISFSLLELNLVNPPNNKTCGGESKGALCFALSCSIFLSVETSQRTRCVN